MDKTITQMIEEVAEEICNSYCRYPYEPIPEGKDEDWLTEDPESPCQNCPLNRLSWEVERMEKVLSQEELDQLVKDAEAKNAARNRAIYLLQDAKARYVKEKTRARSKKAAMDREEMLKSPRFKCLEDYERKEDIMDAYGWDIITSADVDRLEALWDEREQIKNHVDDNGDYSDLVTKALWEAHKTLIELWQDEIDEAEVTAKKWKEERQKAEMEAKAWLDKQNEEYLKFMGGQ